MPPFQLSLKIYLDKSGERIHMQNNNIIDFLDLEDPDIIVTDITITDMQKVITIESVPSKHFCPICQSRMYSRGIKTRTVHHPILQDGFDVILKVRQRRWRCTNSICEYEMNESFRFVNKGRRYTNASDMLIVNEFRKLTRSARDIARHFNTTDSNVLNIFDRYVDMKRLPLTDAISLDEVYLDMDENCKYTLVIQDFHTGNGPIESLNRKAKDLKRQGRGYRNFGHLRNRFLFATRNNAPLNGREEEQQSYVDYED